MSQPLTFPCPFCGRRMGVGMELAGKHVRCPHCKQIVLAPSAAAPTASAAFVAPPPPPPQPDPDPMFNSAPREGPDSILGDPEESDDEVFSSSKNGTRMRIPDLPEPGNPWGINDPATRVETRQAPPEQPADANPFAFPPAPPPAERGAGRDQQPAPPPPPRAEVKSNNDTTAEHTNPFSDFEPPTPLKPEVAPPPPPPVAPIRPPAPRPVPPPAAPPANPWSGLDAMAANPTVTAPALAPAPVPVFLAPPQPLDLPVPVPVPVESPPRQRPQPAASGVSKGAFYAVAGYALVATALAVYGLFIKSGDKIDPGHPLSTIPDNFGEFDPTQRKKVGKLTVPVDGELPKEQRVALGGKLTIGQLEVEPLKVVSRPLKIVGQLARTGRVDTVLVEKDRERKIDSKSMGDIIDRTLQPTPPALVLTLRVKNTGDLPVYPLDPAFSRKERSGMPTPATGLVVGGKSFWGGEIDWPFRQQVKRMFEEEQTSDALPLKPGESREYVVFTSADGRAREALKAHGGTATWRVQVRRGLVSFKGKDVPVTAIVGVEFTKTDVSGL